MLRFMRENAGSWIIKILLAVVVIVFIFLGLNPGDPKNQNVAAVVNKKVIPMEEYRNTYNNVIQRYKSQFGDGLNDELIKMLRIKENTLESLIDRELILQESAKLGMKATDEELKNFISSSTYFQENGQFSPSLYANYFKYTNQRPENFEEAQRNELQMRKFQRLIGHTAPVTESEIREWFNREKSEVSITYALFDKDAQTGIKPGEEEIRAYYDKHSDNYKSEPAVRVNLIQFKPVDFSSKVTVSDKEVEASYSANMGKYETPKTVEARHILIKVDQGADQAQIEKARAKAQDVYQLAVTEGKDFAELARTYSDDSTKDKGGYLGAFEQNRMVKPFADKAFSMKAGEISTPVKTQFGWHLIKVEKVNEAKRRQLADVKEEIRSSLIKDKTASLAYEASDMAYDLIIGGADLGQAAQAANQVMIETGFFPEAQGPSEIEPSVASDFSKAVFGMPVKQTSDILEFKGIYYIVQMIEKKGSEVRPFDDVREKVASDLIVELKDEQARKSAENFIVSLKEGKSDFDLTKNASDSGFFTRDAQGATQSLDPVVVKAAFDLTQGKNLSETPIKVNKGYYVIRLKERKTPDLALFEKEKGRLKAELEEKKQSQAYSHWLGQLKNKAEIERNSSYFE